jgi:uncharacterized protein (DUF1778 family)
MAKEFVRLSLNISKEESDALQAAADRDNRTRTEVVREWLRSLPTYRAGEKS